MSGMGWRELVALLVSIAVARPIGVDAQTTHSAPKIVFLAPGPQSYQEEFTRGLRDLGYVGGVNAIVEFKFTDGRDEGLPLAAKELADRQVNVIVASNSAATAAAMAATKTIPIVMVTSGDPVGSNFVKSLSRPGGNVTGLSSLVPEVSFKQIELLKDADPRISKVVVFWNSRNSSNLISLPQLIAASKSLGLELRDVEIQTPSDLETAFRRTSEGKFDAILTLIDQVTIRHRADVVEFARSIKRPAMYPLREFVSAGGLMSYGVSFPDLHYRAAKWVDRILKGTSPAELPVEQPTKFHFMINLKTASNIGLTLPPSFLVLADEVIE
jgi:putative ABC transport system substrate-binding protein